MISGLTKLCAVYRVGIPNFLSRFGQPPVSSGRVVILLTLPPNPTSPAIHRYAPFHSASQSTRNLLEPRVRAPVGNVGAAAAPPQARTPATPPDGDRELDLCCFLGALLLSNVASTALMATRRAFGRDSVTPKIQICFEFKMNLLKWCLC